MLTGLHQPHCQQHLPLPGHHLPALPLPLLQDECHQLQAQEAPCAQGNTIEVIYSLIARFHFINLFCPGHCVEWKPSAGHHPNIQGGNGDWKGENEAPGATCLQSMLAGVGGVPGEAAAEGGCPLPGGRHRTRPQPHLSLPGPHLPPHVPQVNPDILLTNPIYTL